MARPVLDPASLTALHALAEHVLAAALHRETGRIDLQAAPGGFSTPPFGDDQRRIRVEGVTLVVGPPGREQKAPITTLAAAAALAGIEPGAPPEVYPPVTACDPEAALEIDPATARALASWYALGDEALTQWARIAAPAAPAAPESPTLWPEHFDLAIRTGEVNYGFSPPDGSQPLPYAYVGPSAEFLASATAAFWNAPYGAARTWDEIATAADGMAFFRAGHRLLAEAGAGG